MAYLSIHLLGSFEATIDDQPVTHFESDKVRALLAYLAVEADRPHRREALAGLLWPEMPERTARANLRYALADLRRVLGDRQAVPPFLLITRQTLQFNRDSGAWVDAGEFASLVPGGEVRQQTISQLEQAVALFRGEFLEGFTLRDSAAFEEWLLLHREHLARLRLAALHRLTAYHEAQGAYETALRYAWAQVGLEPWQEDAHQQLIKLLVATGQRTAALAQYESLRQVLQQELGVDPSPETEELYQRILSGKIEPEPEAQRDQIIRGYDLLERIGEGNAGAVYRAYQPILGREVAVKVILPRFANQPEFIRRFEVEAQLVARLEHLHIVPLYDYWREPDGAYLVMRLFQAGSLKDSLDRGPWTPEAAASVLDQIASALVAAHGQGVVHQDIKPANILLDEGGNAYLSDFGIARDVTAPLDPTTPETMTGSPEYAAPEQWQGGPIAPLVDQYSLGVVLYEMLTGKHPFLELTPDGLRQKHLFETLPSVCTLRPELPPAIDQVVQQATAKDAGSRYPDALALADAFRRSLAIPTAVVPQVEPRNPYKGLRPFQEADTADFFGREALIQHLLERLRSEDRFLAVVGPSGSGKSSAVHAGLIPALRRGALPGSEDWFVATMQPGDAPFERFADALMRVAFDSRAVENAWQGEDANLLLVIDQFEELFTLVEDETERAHFLSSLLAASSEPDSHLRLVITLRADHYDRPLQYAGFGELVRQNTEVVLPMSPQELEQAIVGPAERVGVTLEPGLVAAIVTDVIEQPGALPLLQYALTELFEDREDRELSLQAYQAMGGVLGSLGRRAEELYGSLDEAGQEATRHLFLQLVTLHEGLEVGRRRALRTDLAAIAEEREAMEEVTDAFGRHRLLSFDRDPATRIPTVEVAHEALFREWDRLREWLDENRDDLRSQQRLVAAAAEWLNTGRAPGFLLRGTRLDQFEAWANATDLALSQVELDYLQASLTERRERQAEETARQAREVALERRSRNFLRALVGILALATLVALILTAFAFGQRRDALEAYSLSLAANAKQALSAKDTATALNLALAANRIDRPPLEAQRTLMDAAFAPGPRRRLVAENVFEGAQGAATTVALSPDGRTALAGYCVRSLSPEVGDACEHGSEGVFILWDLETGAEIHRFMGHTAGVNDLAFSPDGQMILSGSEDATAILWDAVSGREVRRFSEHSGAVRTVAISPDGRRAITGGRAGDSVANPGELILWDLATGQEIRRFEGNTAEVLDAVFAPDGRAVLASSGGAELIVSHGEVYDVSLILWDIETGEIIRRFEEIDDDAISIAISPDGATALTGSWGRKVYLWGMNSGKKIQVFEGHKDLVTTVAFCPAPLPGMAGRRAISGSDDDSLILWDLETGESMAQFMVHDNNIFDVAVSSDGRTAVSGSRSGALILWDLYDGGELARFEGHDSAVFDVAFSPDGKQLLSGSGSGDPAAPTAGDTSLRLWDLATGQEIRRLEGHTGVVMQVAFSPDGRRALSSSQDMSVRLWDLATGQETGRFVGHQAPVTGIAFHPDSHKALSCSVDGTVVVWNLESGEIIHRLTGHTLGSWSVAISPDGHTALSGSDDSILILWDLETGQEIRRFLGHDRAEEASVSGIAYLPDGRTALSGGTDGYLIHWDLETGQEIRRFGGHSGIRTRVSVSPDGRLAFSSGWDGTLMLWDLETGKLLRRFKDPQTGFVCDSAMSPDGQTGLVGSSAQTIVHWQLATPSLDELFNWVDANRHVRELDCDQRELYQIEPLCER